MKIQLALSALLTAATLAPVHSQTMTLIPITSEPAEDSQDAWFSGPLTSATPLSMTLPSSENARQPTPLNRTDPANDTYSLAPLIQGGVPIVYALTSPTESTLTFNATPTNIGANFRGSSGGTFSVTSSFLEDGGGPGIDKVSVSVTALNSSLQREPWVAAGETGNEGATLFTWRLDVGAFNASNTILPNNRFAVKNSGVEIYDVAGSLVVRPPTPGARRRRNSSWSGGNPVPNLWRSAEYCRIRHGRNGDVLGNRRKPIRRRLRDWRHNGLAVGLLRTRRPGFFRHRGMARRFFAEADAESTGPLDCS